MILPNLFTALITPFSNEHLDLKGFEKNLNDQKKAGVLGLLVLGTTGESPTLSIDEKEALLKTAAAFLEDQTHLMVGVGTHCTKTSIENAHMAKHFCASSALAITPYYNKPSQRGLFNHFKTLALNTPLPLILYNHPGRTGQNIELETLLELLKIPQIIGIKDASSDLNYLQKIAYFTHKARPDFKIYCGDDLNALPYFSLGAAGLISVASNLIPQTIRKGIKMLVKKDFSNSLKHMQQLYPLLTALNLEVNPTGIKAALNLCEKPAGDPRLPLMPFSSKNQEILKQTLMQTESIHGEIKPPSYQASI